MLHLGSTGTWSLSSLQPSLVTGTPALPHAPMDCWSPPSPTLRVGKIFAATVWIFVKRKDCKLASLCQAGVPWKSPRSK